jgi:hypothetical protein
LAIGRSITSTADYTALAPNRFEDFWRSHEEERFMPSEPEERLDRRDFMIASVATIGASAALVVDARSQNARTSATPVSPASGASSASVYIGDTIQGKKSVVHDGGKCFPWETFVSRLSPAICINLCPVCLPMRSLRTKFTGLDGPEGALFRTVALGLLRSGP